MNDSPSPADMPPRAPSPDALQRKAVRDLITGTALKLTASTDIDLDAMEALAKLLDAQTRSHEVGLKRAQFYAAKASKEASA
ncbi:hypothetical protein RCO28_30470 [Streptomyces sp. LHD-70]|uniref:hypothetical protein n=1 Tax=Streptomyces sp. LHD-70 TaxID=3072140 RepID=UPI0028106BE6|nr:hypothetical protein [Streptomyces sp. LHD-70]MDQ8706765.1 hypothetical protein [Streptomyces sp. LHD-70]